MRNGNKLNFDKRKNSFSPYFLGADRVTTSSGVSHDKTHLIRTLDFQLIINDAWWSENMQLEWKMKNNEFGWLQFSQFKN